MAVVDILGYKISANGLDGDIDEAWRLIKLNSKVAYVACANPHSLVVANSDERFMKALKGADILLPDGAGIVLASKILKCSLHERVAGFEFFDGLTKRANKNSQLRYFFLGSSEQVLARIIERIRMEAPQILVCGSYSPPYKNQFSEEDINRMIGAINPAKPDVLWVGMTAPKQEKWIIDAKDRLDVRLIGAIGAVFDFYAGTRKRAPAWVCKLGLEWLPRLLREPRRLFRRNFISTPLFLGMLFRERLRQVLMREG